jgi:tetratricopeptide (TPR) repeat protein
MKPSSANQGNSPGQGTSSGQGASSIRSLLDRGLLDLALEQARDATAKSPNDPQAWQQLAMALAKYRDFNGAVEALEQGLRVSPGAIPLLVDLAAATLNNGEVERSMELTRVLRASMAGNPWPILNEAQVHLRRNRFAEAEATLLEVPEGQRDPVEWGISMGTVLVARKEWGRAEDVLNGVVASERATNIGKALALFQVAKLREKQGDYDGSWAAATEAHRQVNRPTTADRYRREAEAIREVMHRSALEGWARATEACEEAVLIVGMPRSGTSLLEQVLSMHPDVANAGELAIASTLERQLPLRTDSFLAWPKCIADMQEPDADAMQAMYRRELRMVGQGKKRVTDKSLLLVFQLGFISRLLPGARSIMLRRNPLDNIVSCYTTHLACLGHAYTSDVKVLAEVWKLRDELQDFWMENLDPVPLDLHYESLVSDQEAQTRRLLAHLDLPWNDACLRFHESDRVARTISFDQVNQKMYTSSVERWKRYEKHLGPAIEVLGL